MTLVEVVVIGSSVLGVVSVRRRGLVVGIPSGVSGRSSSDKKAKNKLFIFCRSNLNLLYPYPSIPACLPLLML